MVELAEVAKLMDDDIVGHLGRQQSDAVAEVQVAFLGARSPAGLLVPDGHPTPREAIRRMRVPMTKAGMHERAGGFLVLQECMAMATRDQRHRVIIPSLAKNAETTKMSLE